MRHTTFSLLLTTNRGISAGTHHSIMQTVKEIGCGYQYITDGGLDRARGLLVSNWLRQTNDEAFVMVDDDMQFTSQQIRNLVDVGLDVVSATYPTRHGEALTGLPLHPEQDHAAFSTGSLLELEHVGMGCVAVRRETIENMVSRIDDCDDGTGQTFWPLFLPMVRERQYYSEDAAFSVHAREAGARLWMHTAIRTTHLCNGFPVHVDNLPFIRQANSALA